MNLDAPPWLVDFLEGISLWDAIIWLAAIAAGFWFIKSKGWRSLIAFARGILNAAEILLRQRREQEQIGAFQRGAPQPNLDAIGGDRLPLTQYGPTEQDFQAEMARRESEIDAFNEQLQELRDIGSQVGATFASAFESVVSGANSAREAVASLARSLGSSVLQSVFRSLGANIAGSFARDGGPSATVRTPGVN